MSYESGNAAILKRGKLITHFSSLIFLVRTLNKELLYKRGMR
jgi:hypothetical protein